MTSAVFTKRRFAFVFPTASGHINPSLPIARALVKRGHDVHYQCREQMREAIEDTGATFHDEIANLPEMYEGRVPDLHGALHSLCEELGLEGQSLSSKFSKVTYPLLELMIPGTLRFLQTIQPDVVVCCPMLNKDAVCAAKILGLPCATLLTTAGAGSLAAMWQEFVDMSGAKIPELAEDAKAFTPSVRARQQLQSNYNLDLRDVDFLEPLGVYEGILESTITLVTTSEDLQDPMTPEMEEAYASAKFEFVGPLLDVDGAVRAASHKMKGEESHAETRESQSIGGASVVDDPVAAVRAARASGRQIVLASMGTVITGDDFELGWDAKPLQGRNGERKGLTGRELCQAAWGGVFDAFGADGDKETAPLVILAIGPQDNALGDLRVPDNAICAPVLPQVEILKAGVDIFLTHGGQNSFTESLSEGVPVVVCPGFGDQKVNARKAVNLGVGLQVERPAPSADEARQAIATYRQSVCGALKQISVDQKFKRCATRVSARLKAAGGVARAVELISALAEPCVQNAPTLPSLLSSSGRQTGCADRMKQANLLSELA